MSGPPIPLSRWKDPRTPYRPVHSLAQDVTPHFPVTLVPLVLDPCVSYPVLLWRDFERDLRQMTRPQTPSGAIHPSLTVKLPPVILS